MRIATLIGLAGLAMAPAIASADVILESEGNNASGSANALLVFNTPGDSVLIDGGLTPEDVDYYRLEVTGESQIVVASFGRPNSTVGDTIIALFNSAGAEVAFDDDNGVANYSSFDVTVPAGVYFLAISGFGDRNFDGTGHDEALNYKLIVGANVVPGPGAIALAGLGGLVAFRRRRA